MERKRLVSVGLLVTLVLGLLVAVNITTVAGGPPWTPLPIEDDPLLRMPGTQPADGVVLEAPNDCMACHSGYDPEIEPGFNWQGSMMAQAARDFIFWTAFTVAAQDSIWFLDRPNATDMCLRCHTPKGWMEGRSAELNGSAMTGHDFDGVMCDMCHRMYDPFHEETYNGNRPTEGDDWIGYFDEASNKGLFQDNPAKAAAWMTYIDDRLRASNLTMFNGNPFYGMDGLPTPPDFRENGSGQYFVSTEPQKRASFADHGAPHKALYSRYHKSKFFCATCHDVSNPVMANYAYDGTKPGDGVTELPTETLPPSAYAHVERTFSEFMLSDYGLEGGAPGIGPYDPGVFETSRPNNNIATCQDCHMPDGVGRGCRFPVLERPTESRTHPQSGQPVHDLTGGNMWVPWILSSTVLGAPNYDAFNDSVLNAGPAVLTLDLTQGYRIEPLALLDAVDRTRVTLERAASITDVDYDASTGDLTLRVQNQTGHKLISGYPEGRRMILNIKAYSGATLLHEINPYDDTVGTLKGLPLDYSPSSPPLGANEQYIDALVYEAKMSSSITGQDQSFHFILSDGRYKDNRIPPIGFRIAEAAERDCEPAWAGSIAPGFFTAAEYAGGYDQVDLMIPAGADRIEVGLFYQTISREYVEFLEAEIKGTATSLPSEAYIAQTEPFFDQLREWGRAIRRLWNHNMNVPGAAPVEMTGTTFLP